MRKLVLSLTAVVFSTGLALAENPFHATGPNSPQVRAANAYFKAYRKAHPTPPQTVAFSSIAPISGPAGAPQVQAAQAINDARPRGPARDMPQSNGGNISRTSLGGTVGGHTGVLH